MPSKILKRKKLALVRTNNQERQDRVLRRRKLFDRKINFFQRKFIIDKLIENLLNLSKKEEAFKIEVYIPNASEVEDKDKIEEIKSSLHNYFNSGNVFREKDNEPLEIWGSWSFTDWFKSITPTLKNETSDIYKDLKETSRRASIDKLGADNMLKRAKATSEILRSIENIDEIVLRLGDVVLAKAEVNGKTRVIIETLTPSLARQLDENPRLLKDPIFFIEQSQSEKLANKKA